MSETTNCKTCKALVWKEDVPDKTTGNCWRCETKRLKEIVEGGKVQQKGRKKKDKALTALEARRFLAGAPPVEDLLTVLSLIDVTVETDDNYDAICCVARWMQTFVRDS